MSVFNGDKYLSNSIDSILNQTYSDIELLILNDGSTDNTSRILNSYQKHQKMLQVISVLGTLNYCLVLIETNSSVFFHFKLKVNSLISHLY